MTVVWNIYSAIAERTDQESVETLLHNDCFRLERIVSDGHATPEAEWFDQSDDEWVILLRGSAGLAFDGEPELTVLNPGEHILIPAHQKHRVEWTSATEPTVWIALHYNTP